MWQAFVFNLIFVYLPIAVISAWVEIPQVPTKNPQFVFGTPNLPLTKISATTPTNYKSLMTTVPTPKKALTTTPMSIPQLKKPTFSNKVEEIADRAENNEQIQEPPKLIGANKTLHNDQENNESSNSGFLPLLHSIQQTLVTNAKKSLKSKISLLTNLRDNLLINIDERMAKLWNPTEDAVVEARGHDEHEMDFPSNEGALLTIGFLTFAVFLIKLVLKLIHALKNKQMTTTTMMGMTDTSGTNGGMTNGLTYFGRKKREVDDYDSLRIIQLIDEYKFT